MNCAGNDNPAFMLRRVPLGISIRDLDPLTIGLVNDMISENQRDEYRWREMAGRSSLMHFKLENP